MKVGIVGAGLMGKRRAASLKEFPNMSLEWVADVVENNAKDLAAAYNAISTTDHKELIKNVDVVFVCVVNNQLARITKDAIVAGKHVLVEKPVATSLADAEELLKLSSEKQVIKVGFNHRFIPTVRKAKELFDEGRIGELMFIKATYGQKGRIGFENEWRAKKEIAGGGELLDQGVHVIDLCRLFMGEITKSEGTTKTLFWKCDVDDNAFFQMENEKGIPALVHVSSALWRNTFYMEMQGTTGRIEIYGIRGHYGAPRLTLLTRNEKKSEEIGVYQFDEEVMEFADEDVSWQAEMQNFVNAVNGKDEPNGTLSDAVAALKVVFGLYK